jgi:hypothetical protein
MIFQEIYSDIVNSFGNLWKTKVRGNTLEIITPFATTNHKFVSVFLTQQNDQFVVSDGGWIQNFEYESPYLNDVDAFQRLLYHYIDTFQIKEVKGPNDKTFFYKKTENLLMVPSIVFDMSNFISSIVSACNVEFVDIKEEEARKLFQSHANNYISQIVPKEYLDIKGFVDANKTVRVSAIYKKNNLMILINYITGSNPNHFIGSIGKSNMIFEMASKSVYVNNIKNKINLINNNADGYIPNKVENYLSHLANNTNAIPIKWSEKESLIPILN